LSEAVGNFPAIKSSIVVVAAELLVLVGAEVPELTCVEDLGNVGRKEA
jgi:hypothetical protein